MLKDLMKQHKDIKKRTKKLITRDEIKALITQANDMVNMLE